MKSKQLSFTFVANSQIDFKGMSGGDKIFLSLAKAMIELGHTVEIWGCEEARKMCVENKLGNTCVVISKYSIEKFGLLFGYLFRSIGGLFLSRKSTSEVFFSTSDFFPDVFCGLAQKLRNRNIFWMGALFLVAPVPFKSNYSNNLHGWIYFISQRFVILLMRWKMNLVLVLNENDKLFLINHGIKAKNVLVIDGGVDLKTIARAAANKKHYEALFIGRFHPQKGLELLVNAWKLVVKQIPMAKLAIIGWGDKVYVEKIKLLSSELGAVKSVEFLGFVDNVEKYGLLKSSKLFVFPSLYESWGVVVAEALACGVPVVAFKTSIISKFGSGVSVVDTISAESLADAIVLLLKNDRLYLDIKSKIYNSPDDFSWGKSAQSITKTILL